MVLQSTERVPGGPTPQKMMGLAKELGVALIIPVYEVEEEGVFYNTARGDWALTGPTWKQAYRERRTFPMWRQEFWEKFPFPAWEILGTRFSTWGFARSESISAMTGTSLRARERWD